MYVCVGYEIIFWGNIALLMLVAMAGLRQKSKILLNF
jgi:hypothetical protein